MTRNYVMKTTLPVPEEDLDAARRMVAARAADAAEQAELEAMLGIAA